MDFTIHFNSTKDFGNRNNLAADGDVIQTASNNTDPPVAIPDGYADIADAILSGLILSL